MPKTKESALKVIAHRYAEQQLMKAQEIIMDFSEELSDAGLIVEAQACDRVFDLLAEAIHA
jgi:hypothetical protein